MQWLANAEQLVGLEAKLIDVLMEKATPTDNRERLGLLEVCRLQRRHVAAARLYADAFTADPKLADDLKASHRYNAACFAALAAAGQGTDAGKLDDKEHSRLRHQALAWLRADLDVWSKRLEGSDPAERPERWKCSSAGSRHRPGRRACADALRKLPAEEREAMAETVGRCGGIAQEGRQHEVIGLAEPKPYADRQSRKAKAPSETKRSDRVRSQ